MNFFQTIWNWITSLFGAKSAPIVPVPIPMPGGTYSLLAPVPGLGWQITHSSSPPPAVVNNGFDFPLAANANVGWVSYFELPFTRDISQASSISITYTLTGSNPVFDHSSPNNVSTGPSTIAILLHRAGDDLSGRGSTAYFRWFGPILTNLPSLELGTHTLTVPLTLTSWASLADQQEQWFRDALSNLGSIGVVFGGGDFYSHGLCVKSGTARFHLDNYTIT